MAEADQKKNIAFYIRQITLRDEASWEKVHGGAAAAASHYKLYAVKQQRLRVSTLRCCDSIRG
jgi:hypothetical protein